MKLNRLRSLVEVEGPQELWWLGLMGRNSFPVLHADFQIAFSPPASVSSLFLLCPLSPLLRRLLPILQAGHGFDAGRGECQISNEGTKTPQCERDRNWT